MIILLGFPKSGTTSFHVLFESLGYKSYHFIYDNQNIGTLIQKQKQDNKPLLGFLKEESLDHVCLTQMDVCLNDQQHYWPQIVDYIQLFQEYPNAIYILNKRDPTKLLDSFKRWDQLDQRLCRYNPELIEKFNPPNDNKLIQLFIHHYNQVEHFFKQRPRAKFISFNIETDQLSKLSQYIDIKNHTKLPHINMNILNPPKQ